MSLEGFAFLEGVTRCRIYRASQGGSASGAEVGGCWVGLGGHAIISGPK